MCRKYVIAIIFCLSLWTILISAQTVSVQFMETKYNIKDFCMVDSVTSWSVGGVHWDQSAKRFKSTVIKTSNAGVDWIV